MAKKPPISYGTQRYINIYNMCVNIFSRPFQWFSLEVKKISCTTSNNISVIFYPFNLIMLAIMVPPLCNELIHTLAHYYVILCIIFNIDSYCILQSMMYSWLFLYPYGLNLVNGLMENEINWLIEVQVQTLTANDAFYMNIYICVAVPSNNVLLSSQTNWSRQYSLGYL